MKKFGYPNVACWNHRYHLLRKGSGGVGASAGLGDDGLAAGRGKRGDEGSSQTGIGKPLKGLEGLNGKGEVGNQQTPVSTYALQNRFEQVRPSTMTTRTYKSVIHYNLLQNLSFRLQI